MRWPGKGEERINTYLHLFKERKMFSPCLSPRRPPWQDQSPPHLPDPTTWQPPFPNATHGQMVPSATLEQGRVFFLSRSSMGKCTIPHLAQDCFKVKGDTVNSTRMPINQAQTGVGGHPSSKHGHLSISYPLAAYLGPLYKASDPVAKSPLWDSSHPTLRIQVTPP